MCKVRKEALIIQINILKLVQKQYIYKQHKTEIYIYIYISIHERKEGENIQISVKINREGQNIQKEKKAVRTCIIQPEESDRHLC